MSKTVLITGTSQGIGKEIVGWFFENTDFQIVTLSRNTSIAPQKNSNKHKYLQFDLTKAADFQKLVPFFQTNNIQQIDILINNAGYLYMQNFQNFEIQQARKIFEVNFFGAAQLIQHCIPYLKQAQQAHVVNIGSMGGFQGSTKFPELSFYSASKAALANLSEVLAAGFSETNIKFNTLALGSVQTEMLSNAFPHYKAPVSAKQMAAFIADFAQNGATFFNGKTIPVAITTP